jgi:hypothetical protein
MKELLQSQAGRRSSLATLKNLISQGNLGLYYIEEEVEGFWKWKKPI